MHQVLKNDAVDCIFVVEKQKLFLSIYLLTLLRPPPFLLNNSSRYLLNRQILFVLTFIPISLPTFVRQWFFHHNFSSNKSLADSLDECVDPQDPNFNKVPSLKRICMMLRKNILKLLPSLWAGLRLEVTLMWQRWVLIQHDSMVIYLWSITA